MLNVPVSCDPNCELDFIEYQNKQYICLRFIKNENQGSFLKLRSKKEKYCFDYHEEQNENEKFFCKISLSSKKSNCILNFFKECTLLDDLPEIDSQVLFSNNGWEFSIFDCI